MGGLQLPDMKRITPAKWAVTMQRTLAESSNFTTVTLHKLNLFWLK